jgi:UPF0716 protein FxsA
VPLLALLAIFVIVPLAELYVIFVVGDAIGILPTLAILVADSLIGSMLLKSQGRAVWRRFNETMSSGRIPHREVIDGVLVIFGGAFLITPGFLTDIVGILLLLPPTRSFFRRLVTSRLGARAAMGAADMAGARVRGRRRAAPGWDVEGTASERTEPDFELPPRTGDARGGPPKP